MTYRKRSIYESDHDLLRSQIRRFLAENAIPFVTDWEAQGYADRKIWNQLGELGAMSAMLSQEFGGSDADMRTCLLYTSPSPRDRG